MRRAHGVVVSRLLRMQKVLGSNPSGSILLFVALSQTIIIIALGTEKTASLVNRDLYGLLQSSFCLTFVFLCISCCNVENILS